jgi:hypothetical protein
LSAYEVAEEELNNNLKFIVEFRKISPLDKKKPFKDEKKEEKKKDKNEKKEKKEKKDKKKCLKKQLEDSKLQKKEETKGE